MEDHLRDKDYLALSKLLERHTGIKMPPSKREMLEGRLRRRARSVGSATLADYGRRLFEQGLIDQEFEVLVDHATTNKTDFFREPDHFDFLRDRAVPALLGIGGRSDRDLNVWSAACSTGAEAYTTAMVLATMQEAGASLRFSILGTDISSSVLEQARSAIYPSAMMDAVAPDMRKRYVMEARDPGRGECRIAPALRRTARFEYLNLMDATYPFPRNFDVIFCRNVLIYFERDVQRAVLGRLTDHLRVGGYLILGHSESFAVNESLAMKQVLPTVFRREVGFDAKRKVA